MNAYQGRTRDEITERIECYIIEQGLKSGDKLPSERQLCEAWDCNRMTFRAAARRLIAEGILENVPNTGYFLAQPKLERYLQDLSSLSDVIRKQGLVLTNRLISAGVVPASKRITQQLDLTDGHSVFELARLRLVDGCPIALETASLPLPRFECIQMFNFEKGSLYDVLENHFGVIPQRGSEEISITYADATEAALLQIEEGTALFFVRSITWDETGRPIEALKSVLRTDRVRFAGELRRE